MLGCPPHHLEKLSTEEDNHTIETAMLPSEGIEPLLLFPIADPGAGFLLALTVVQHAKSRHDGLEFAHR